MFVTILGGCDPVDREMEGHWLGDTRVAILMFASLFADDMLVFTRSVPHLQSMLAELSEAWSNLDCRSISTKSVRIWTDLKSND